MIRTELPKSYNPEEAEGEIRAKWEAARAFHAEPNVPQTGDETAEGNDRRPYCILIPPPNVTAALHLGHALNNTLQDVLIRAHRMMGFNTLWMPGTDHAGIATQTVVEKRLLQNEGKRRTDYSRDEFVAKVQAWKDEYESTILEQLKAMGASCDFERTRFTMDEMCAKAVREAFFRLFKDGLIYRGKRLVNWDPVTQTALADDEVEMREVQGAMHYLRYPLVHPPKNPDDPLDCEEVTWSELAARGYPGAEQQRDDDNAWLTVATTRPETYLGDTAVAVNPKDPRAASLRGLMIQLPLVGRVIRVIEDDFVVMPDRSSTDIKAQIATGFLKVTPAHDPNDYEIGQRHDLPAINVMAPDATISNQHGWSPDDVRDARIFLGLSREEARKKVIDEFKARGLLEAVKPYTHSVGHSYRSHVPIEPYLSDQWYVKVTDDRLKGEALRAMVDDQFEGEKPARESDSDSTGVTGEHNGGTGDAADHNGGTGVPPVMAGSPPTGEPAMQGARVITRRNLPHWHVAGSTYFVTFRLRQGELTEPERQVVLNAAMHWHGRRAQINLVTVMHDHVHGLITPQKKDDGTWWSLSELLHSIKSFSAHEIQKLRGAEGPLWQDESFDRIVRDDEEFLEKWNYMVRNPVDAGLANSPEEYPYIARGSASSAVEASDAVTGGTPVPPTSHPSDGELQFFPARYAKTFQQWHENLRDWCISRQLWWGHRIPVWSREYKDFNEWCGQTLEDEAFTDNLVSLYQNNDDEVHVRFVSVIDGRALAWEDVSDGRPFRVYVCTSSMGEIVDSINGNRYEIGLWLESQGFEQDPDVLDTWFSSGLWPLSTMGWPTPDDYPDTSGLLDTFNPSSVLCTAREIITLWVSRMVMFNRYFRSGTLPFRHVYIHPMIQDGHGQKMSKSLGNGVDPRDIIRSHGADALRFTLAKLATATQDVRLPVDMMCPHEGCGETFEPKEITTPGGHRVAAPEQTCPKCGKKMISGYGYATGIATPTEAIPLARNVSRKFDEGRNFANKLWNATRFALSNLSSDDASTKAWGLEPPGLDALPLVDRWMISRLHRALHTVEVALKQYQYNVYADAMYDLVWREFCDWYLEAIKPTVRENPAQQQVLRTMLGAILRMLHPVMPFVTEALWPHVQEAGEAGLPGIELPSNDLLCLAPWPDIACSVHDEEAEATFSRVQALVEAIRNVRGERNIPPKRKLTLHVPASLRGLIDASEGVIETLAGLVAVEDLAERPGTAVPLTYEGSELYLTGLFGDIGRGEGPDGHDLAAERARLTKMIQDKQKAIAGFRNRLANESYVKKAPAHLVEETRCQLAKAEADLAAAERALQSLNLPGT